MSVTPKTGDLVHVRSRHYVVEDASSEAHGTVVDMACLDDDAQGDFLRVIWELELDGRVITAEAWEGIGTKGFDDQEQFAAFFNTLRWHCVSSTDPRIFHSPFRAGIRLDAYQLEPLRKALLLPRVNMFIADDVGLGKTIEAGLIATALLLRRRIHAIVVACPPAMLGQWRDELETRFGLSFEILDRHYLERVRQQRGFGVNPWTTFPRFLVSQRLLIDDNYAAPLRAWLGNLHPGSLFILDEAHHAAPASGAKYAIDSRITRAIRDLAPRFEHRLFLSATPHNGHSNSFSALLEILDPQRFTRGVKVTKENLDKVMVRRLKEDIRQIEGGFPKRVIVQEVIDGLPEDSPELELARLLDEYATLGDEELKDAKRRKQVEFQLVVSHLQQRLLSCIESFARTLAVHRRGLEKADAKKEPSAKHRHRLLQSGVDRDDDLASATEEEVEQALAAEVEEATAASAGSLKDQRLALLERMGEIAEAHRHAPDARIINFLEWMREHQCGGVGVPAKTAATAGAEWEDTRVIIFTEYETTLRYVRDQLVAAIAGTDDSDHRIEIFYGATPTDKREAIKNAFNSRPAQHPVRILLATDAAREGLNLQAHCNHLFHFDLPWNPGRLEQRNGRIDRKLRPAPEVFCHYFVYAQRPEDRILKKLVEKSERILEELGSLSQILGEKLSDRFTKRGLRRTRIEKDEEEIESAGPDQEQAEAVNEDLEATRERHAELKERFAALQRQLEQSRKALHFQSSTFQSALSSSLELAGFPPLKKVEDDRFEFPVEEAKNAVDHSWAATLDSLREPPKDGKRDWKWRKEAPVRRVTFTPPESIDDTAVQLHLGHRVSQRLLARFLSQGFRENDLSRACFGQTNDNIPRVVLLGRLGLYGPRASRLHEEVITVTAAWSPPDERGGDGLKPYARGAEAHTMEMLEESMSNFDSAPQLSSEAHEQLLASLGTDIAELRPHFEVRGGEAKAAAAKRLEDRARIESEEMTRVLELQRARVLRTLQEKDKTDTIDLFTSAEERRQLENDIRYWRKWLEDVEENLETEPSRIRAFYDVQTTRIEPAGIVYLWPA